jgi:hypothetical protein
MKQRVFLVTLTALLALVSLYCLFAYRADDELLNKISIVKPGAKLEAIRSQLGHQMYALTSVNEVLHGGPVQDAAFCEGKKLYIFDGGAPPATALDVYTDEQDVVVFVTWHSL